MGLSVTGYGKGCSGGNGPIPVTSGGVDLSGRAEPLQGVRAEERLLCAWVYRDLLYPATHGSKAIDRRGRQTGTAFATMVSE